MSSKILVVIGGPTAVGKTSFAIKLSHHFNTVILSADSRQFYREMSIGTAKPSEAELNEAKHYFINSLYIEEKYSVGDFERDAINLLKQLFEKYNPVLLCGGSGLYIKAICEGLDKFPPVVKGIQEQLIRAYEEKGIKPLQKELADKDPEYMKEVDEQNPHRLIRALSVIRSSGKPFSSFRREKPAERPFTPLRICLYMDREKLYKRINTRVDKMLEAGLIEEAKKLYPQKHLNALQTVGYQELFDYFDGKISLDDAVALIKRNTRRYAKRQMTWFRNQGNWIYISPEEPKEAIALIQKKLAHDLEK